MYINAINFVKLQSSNLSNNTDKTVKVSQNAINFGKNETELPALTLKDKSIIKDYREILETQGIKSKTDKQGYLILSHLQTPENNQSFKEIGIDIDQLFKYTRKIKGNASIYNDEELTSLGVLEEIEGYAEFTGCKNLKEAKNLIKIGQSADFDDCNSLEALDNLKSIGGSGFFSHCSSLKSMENLEYILGGAYFKGCKQLNCLDSLQYIGEYANFNNCKELKALKSIKAIKGACATHESPVEIPEYAKQPPHIYCQTILDCLLH